MLIFASRTVRLPRPRSRTCTQKAFGWGHGAEPEVPEPMAWSLASRPQQLDLAALPSWQGCFVSRDASTPFAADDQPLRETVGMRHDAGQHLAETAMETQSSRRGSMYALLSEYFLQCKCQASEILRVLPTLHGNSSLKNMRCAFG